MHRLKNFLRLQTSKDVIINTSGNYLGVLFAFFYTLILARALSIEEFGTLTVLLAIAYVLANILDFGITASIYSYLPPIITDKPKSVRFIKSNFIYLTSLASITLIILFFASATLDRLFFKLAVPQSLYGFALLSVLFFIWQNFVLNVLYASKRFLYANIAVNLSHFVKTILLTLLVYWGAATIQNVIIILGIAGPAIFMSSILLHKPSLVGVYTASDLDKQDIKLGYSLTYFAATQLFSIASRADLFLISFFLVKTELGYYALAQRIILAIITSVNSISQVLSPQFAEAKTRTQVKKLFKTSFIYMLAPASIFVVLVLTPDWLYGLAFTDKFIPTAAIARPLAIAYILYGFSIIPLLYFLYTARRPVYMLMANFIFLVVAAGGSYLLIPTFGVFGPPRAYLAAFLAIILFAVIALSKNLKSK
ncbi:MAG: oligosaccharide flippase family protein [Candidatus Paceibacterota bacterium]